MLDLFITSERGSTKSKVHVWQLKIFCHMSDSNKNLKFDGATIINEKPLTELLPT